MTRTVPQPTPSLAGLLCSALLAASACMAPQAAQAAQAQGAAVEYRLNGAAVYQPQLNVTWLAHGISFDVLAATMGGALQLQQAIAAPTSEHSFVVMKPGRYTNSGFFTEEGWIYGRFIENWEEGTPGHLSDFRPGIHGETTFRWWAAKAYVQYLNSIEHLGFSDWRLPQALAGEGDCVFNVHGVYLPPPHVCPGRAMNEVQVLAYDLGKREGIPFVSLPGHAVHIPFFSENRHYWLGEEYRHFNPGADGPEFTGDDWRHGLAASFWGNEARDKYNNFFHAMVLRDGDVALGSTPPIPEPGTWALMLAGLGAMAWRARRVRGACRQARDTRANARPELPVVLTTHPELRGQKLPSS